MKNIITSFLILVAVFSISTTANGQNFVLNGTLSSADYIGKSVYIQAIDGNTGDYITTDTLTIENGKFTFVSNTNDPCVLFVSMDDLYRPILFVREDGEAFLELDSELKPSIHGTPLNNKYQELLNKRALVGIKMEAVSDEYKAAKSAGTLTETLEEQINDRYDSLYSEMTQINFDFAKDNLSNVLGQYVFMDRGVTFSADQLSELFASLDASLLVNPKIEKLEKRMEALNAIQMGNPFIDLTGKSPDGTVISLSDYAGKGKVVLVDFWASWCPPCRKEMPGVVKAYEEFKDKGFEIVGISLDEKADAWKKGIADLHITWPQMSDLNGWQSDLSLAYAVNSIPQTFLLDKNGKIIARNLSGERLIQKLSELLD